MKMVLRPFSILYRKALTFAFPNVFFSNFSFALAKCNIQQALIRVGYMVCSTNWSENPWTSSLAD